MSHYPLDQWIDFTRGLGASWQRTRMAEHLDSRCGQCRRNAEFCAHVSQVCQRLKRQRVPEPVISLARTIFPVYGAAGAKQQRFGALAVK